MIELKSSKLKAHILQRGATLAGLWIAGIPRSLVLGFKHPSGFEETPIYAGAIVGPVANRIAGAQLEIDTEHWKMPPNEGSTCLHSGSNGLHMRTWDIKAQTQSSVTLGLDLLHGDIGLPGNRHIQVTYALDDDGVLHLTIKATSDRATVINIAHHPYWSLDDTGSLAEHSLQINAGAYLPITHDTLPTGEIASVADTMFDFRTARAVPTDITIDHNYCLHSSRRTNPAPAAVLTGSTGVRLKIETTEPGLQVYNGSGLPHDGAPMLPGQALSPYAGIALEAQAWPNAPHHIDFPSISLTNGTPYLQKTLYRISTEL